MQNISRKLIFCLGTLSVLTALSLPANAQTRSQVSGDSGAKQAQTLFLRADIGSTTFDSKAAASKETASSTAYEFGGWFGEARIVGMSIKNQTDVVDFSLNDSQSSTNFTDVRLKARLWGIVPSIGVSLSEVDVETTDGKTVGLFGTGVNAGLGFTFTIYTGIVLSAEAMTVQSTHVFDKLALGNNLGVRNEADANISFDITDRLIDLLVGYRVRNYEIETPTSVFQEKAQGVYAGLRLGVYF